ncbi:MAG: FtsW/RodA/SpoVE family cell cycle protein [Bacteroidales bacterium]|nr:FtsW/RodA/SpoVE family cell cycle protein [Bacteroidales bacterium]
MEKKNFFSGMMGGDNWLWGIYLILFFISIVEIASASSRLAYQQVTNDNPLMRHTMFLVVGFFCLVLTLQTLSSIRTSYVTGLGALAYVGGVILMCLLPIFGRRVNGATRDIFGIQPVEFCKVGLIIMLCATLTAKNEVFTRFSFFRTKTEVRRYWFLLIMIGLVVAPIALQNLSTALILGIVSLAIMFLAKVRASYLLKTIGVLSVAAAIFLAMLFMLHKFNESNETAGNAHHTELGLFDRANTWEHRIFDNRNDVPLWQQSINDENRQEMCAHMAIANSNVVGRFIGESQMRDHLPEAYSDYIYAIIFEEMGVEGAAIVMLLYFILLWRCYRLSLKTTDPLKRLLMISIPLLIVVQALIHMGVCTDAMFVTGQPLPLISRGGMSILATSACFGILFGLSHSILKEEAARNQQ